MGLTSVPAMLPLCPAVPSENWRWTDPSFFFLPQGEVLDAAGRPFVENGARDFFWKVQRRDLGPAEWKASLKGEIPEIQNFSSELFLETLCENAHRLVVLSFGHGVVRAWVSRTLQDTLGYTVDLASVRAEAQPLSPSASTGSVCSALAERLDAVCPHECVLTLGRSVYPAVSSEASDVPLVVCINQWEAGLSQSVLRSRVSVGNNCQAEVVTLEGGSAWAHHRIALDLGVESRVQHLWLLPPIAPVAEQRGYFERAVTLSERSLFADSQVLVARGAVKVASRIDFVGAGASSQSGAAVLGWGSGHLDYEPIQNHGKAPSGHSDLLCKMVMSHKAKALFQGLVRILPEAPGCVAYQLNKNLLMGKRARIDSIPRLEINPKDVACKHGSATAELDEAQLYYLTSRGFSESQARYLMVSGFLAEALASLNVSWAHKVTTGEGQPTAALATLGEALLKASLDNVLNPSIKSTGEGV